MAAPDPLEVWYAMYTKPHAEHQVVEVLEARGIDTYLPLLSVWRARRRRVEYEPLFACYAFVHVDPSVVGLSDLAWIPGLRHLVECDGEPVAIPSRVIATIRHHVAELAACPKGRVQVGAPVRITQGPMKDLRAVFEGRLSGDERAQVLVQFLGQLRRCELPDAWLEPV